jgi:phosphate transport system substrate-binding protein
MGWITFLWATVLRTARFGAATAFDATVLRSAAVRTTATRMAFLRAALLWAAAHSDTASAAAVIHGAGATFPAPVYNAWATAYQQSNGVEISYDAVGSGAGIDRIRQHQVDFGASDAPLTSEDLAASQLLQFPVVIGGVVPVINITGIKPGHLKLTGPLLADIYLGHIKKWNDAAIAALNPKITLPNTNITVVYRSDPSGTSLLWTDYLSRSSTEWQSSVGVSLTPKWPTGVGGAGNDGVASYVQRTRFAIGYVEYIYALKHHLSDVALRNHSARFVQASRGTFRAAAEVADWHAASGFQQLPTDLPGNESWPVTGASFILVDKSPAGGGNTRQVLRFFNWALHQGESIAAELDYVPVPRTVVDSLPALWNTLRDSSGKPVWDH